MSEAILSYSDQNGLDQVLRLIPGPLISIGSDPENQLFLPVEGILPSHLQLQFDGESWSFRTSSFKNPIQVNGQPRAQGSLVNGDQIKLGFYLFVFKETQGLENTSNPLEFQTTSDDDLADLLPSSGSSATEGSNLDLGSFNFDDKNLEPVTEEKARSSEEGWQFKEEEPGSLALDDLGTPSNPTSPPTLPTGQGPQGLSPNVSPASDSVADSQFRLDTGTLFDDASRIDLNPPPLHSGGGPPQENLDTGMDVDVSAINMDAGMSAINMTPDTFKENDLEGIGWKTEEGKIAGFDPQTNPIEEQEIVATPTSMAGSGIKIVADVGPHDGFITLDHTEDHTEESTEPAKIPSAVSRPPVYRKPIDSKQVLSGAIVAGLMIACLGFGAFLLVRERNASKPVENPVFEKLVDAFVENKNKTVLKLQAEFKKYASTEVQKSRVKEMSEVMAMRNLASQGQYVQVIKMGEKYLAGDGNFQFAVIPVVQYSLNKLGGKRLDSNELDSAENYLSRSLKLNADTKEAEITKAYINSLKEKRAELAKSKAKKSALKTFLLDASHLLGSGNYKEIIERYHSLTQSYPSVVNNENVHHFYQQAVEILEQKEIGTLELTFFRHGEMALRVKPSKRQELSSVAITPALLVPDGKKVKTLSGSDVVASSSRIRKDLLLVESKGIYYGIEPKEGKIKWSFPRGGSPRILPTMVPIPNAPKHYLGFDSLDRQLHLMSSLDGEEQWRLQLKGTITVPPFTDGRKILVGTEPERKDDWPPRLLILDAFSGDLIGQVNLSSPLSCMPVIDEVTRNGRTKKLLYLFTREGYLFVLSPKTGQTLQGFKLSGTVEYPPMRIPPYRLIFQNLNNEGLISAAEAGMVGLAEKEKWKELQLEDVPGSEPSVDAALVFLAGTQGKAYVFGVEVKNREAPFFWLVKRGFHLGLGFPNFLTATDDGRHVFAVGAGVRSLKFSQFEKGARLQPRWTFKPNNTWPQFGQALKPLEQHGDRIYIQAKRRGDGRLLWAVNSQNGEPLWSLSFGVGLGAAPVMESSYRAFIRTNTGGLSVAFFDNEKVLIEPRDYDVRPLARYPKKVSEPVIYPVDGKSTLFFGNQDGLFYAIESTSGFSAWIEPFTAPAPISNKAIVSKGVVYFSSGQYIYGLDVKDGRKRYEYDLGSSSPFYSGISLHGENLLIGNKNGALYCLQADEEGGDAFLNQRWMFQTDGPIRYQAISDSNMILVGSDDGTLYQLDKNGAQVRRWQLGSAIVANMRVQGNRVLLVTREGEVRCISTHENTSSWKVSLRLGLEPSALAISNYYLFVGTKNGTILQIRIVDGSKIDEFRSGRSKINGLVISKNRILATSDDGRLYTFSIKTGSN